MNRTSAYTQLLNQVAPWALSGDYGDISNLMTKRDQLAASLKQTELDNQNRQLKIDEANRQAEADRKMEEAFRKKLELQTEPSLRDMYDIGRKAALETGNVDDFLKMQQELSKLQKEQQKQQRDDQEWQWKLEKHNKPKGAKKEKTVKMYNMDTGAIEDVPQSEATAKQVQGTHIRADDKRLGTEVDYPSFKKQQEAPPPKEGPSGTESFFKGLFGGDKPGDQPAQAQKDLTEQIKQAAADRPPRPPLPGMKWQRNVKTGEYREVPQ